MHKLLNFFSCKDVVKGNKIVLHRVEQQVDTFIANSDIGKLARIAAIIEYQEFHDLLDLLWISKKTRDEDFGFYSKDLKDFLTVLYKKLNKEKK